MITVGERAVGRDNNFNLLRMVAATAVLVSHAWPFALGRSAVEPLLTLTGYKLGTTAVTIFFAISGFFITKSFDNRGSLADFLVARIARIYPGLTVVLLLSAFVVGPIFTNLPIATYLTQFHTWSYVPRDLLLRHQQYTLPGVFVVDGQEGAVNGSLWTLFYEVSCYGLVVAVGLLRLNRPLIFPFILLIPIAAIFLIPQAEGGNLLRAASTLSLPFALGAAAYVYRRHLPVSAVLASALLAGAALSYHTILYPLLHAVALSYGALWFGFARIPGLRWYNSFGDYSYGMYIYAFPIEQICTTLLRPTTPMSVIAASFPITLVLAVASWKMIEAPALAHRHFVMARLRLQRMREDRAA